MPGSRTAGPGGPHPAEDRAGPREDRSADPGWSTEFAAWMAQTSACTRCEAPLVRHPGLIGAWLAAGGPAPRGVCPARPDGMAGAPHVPGKAVPGVKLQKEGNGTVADETGEPLFKVTETDNMTGWKQYLSNMRESPWRPTFTREEAEATVRWREENITGRYSYEIVPVEAYMTDNEAALSRHELRHGSHAMSDCTDVDCREAAARLRREELDRSFAAAASAPETEDPRQ